MDWIDRMRGKLEGRRPRRPGARGRAPSMCAMFVIACASAASAEEGAAVFTSQCGVCHVLKAEEPPRQGPHLAGIMGRKAGSVAGFPYSKGLKAAGFEWTPEKLEQWLADPQSMIADTYMAYHQDDPTVRAKVVAYLKGQGK